MNKFKRTLDYRYGQNRENDIKKPNIYTRSQINNIIYSINNNYEMHMTDPLIDNILRNTPIPRQLIINKEQIIINRELNSLGDLIQLIYDFPITINCEYNIDIKQLNKIKEPLIELNSMIGIIDVKTNVLDQILFYLQKLHINSGIDYMHTVLYGPPGTGKTEIAKILGKIFSKIGILKNNSFKKVTRTDLVAGYLGQTALKTTSVINSALGGVLFIDEAYALGNSEQRDSFAKECIDTLCEALSNHKDNLMVIIAGYENELNSCFFSYNAGLKSRFPWVFKTEKYTPDDLKQIFIKKVNDINWKINIENESDFFEQNNDEFQYFGRDMEILLLKTKIAHSRRVFCKPNSIKTIINQEDLEKGLELFKKHSNSKDKKSTSIYNMYA